MATYRALRIDVLPPPDDEDTYNGSAIAAMIWQVGGIGLVPFSWATPDGQPLDNESWSSPGRLMGSMDVHWQLAHGHCPDEAVRYKDPMKWMPGPGGPLRRARRPPQPAAAAPALGRPAAQGVRKAIDVSRRTTSSRTTSYRVEVRPPPRHHPRLPRPLQPVTAMTSTPATPSAQPCCEEYAAMQRAAYGAVAAAASSAARSPWPAPRPWSAAPSSPPPPRWPPAPLGAGRGLAARRVRRAQHGRPARRPGLLPGPAQHRDPLRPAAGQGRHVRPAPGDGLAGAAVDRRARSPRCTRPGCPWPTGRTSTPWRRSRTPTPAPGRGSAGSTG